MPISEIAEVNPRLPSEVRRDEDKPVSFVAMADVAEGGFVAAYQERSLRDVVKGYTYFRRGDVLSAKITPCMQNGKAAETDAMPHGIGFGSTEFHVLRPGPQVAGRYLFHMIWSPYYRRSAERSFTGTAGQQRVPTDFFDRFKIPLPSLPKQKRIATILDKADALRRKRQQSLQLTGRFLHSTFLDMFGDPVTNPKGWPLKRLDEIAVITTGNTPPRREPRHYGDAIEWIKSDNINTPFHFLTEATEYLSDEGRKIGRVAPAGATLVTCIAGSPECIGNVALADREVAFNQQINSVAPNTGTAPYFLYTQLLVGKRLVQRGSTESTKGMVSKGRLSEVQVMCPVRHLQERFGKFFLRQHDASERMQIASNREESLFNSLVQRAFRGEL
jgi:type I restriction enzyme S subunit